MEIQQAIHTGRIVKFRVEDVILKYDGEQTAHLPCSGASSEELMAPNRSSLAI